MIKQGLYDLLQVYFTMCLESVQRCMKWSPGLNMFLNRATGSVANYHRCMTLSFCVSGEVTTLSPSLDKDGGGANTTWDERDGWYVKAEDVISVSVEHKREGTVRTTFRPNPQTQLSIKCLKPWKHFSEGSLGGSRLPCCLSPVKKPVCLNPPSWT